MFKGGDSPHFTPSHPLGRLLGHCFYCLWSLKHVSFLHPLETPKKGLLTWVIGKLGRKEPDMCELKSVNSEENIVNNSFSIFSPSFLIVLE